MESSNKEYSFSKAWESLIEGNIITSKNTNYSYAADRSCGRMKLKFYNPVMERWQICNYFSSDELIDNWYIKNK